MQIELNLFASFREYLPKDNGGLHQAFELDAEATIGDVLGKLRLPADAAKVIFVNGTRGDANTILNEGDRVGIFPLVAGG